jgi:hypothetical protein
MTDQLMYVTKKTERVLLSSLLAEIKDKSLEAILRRVVFSGENVVYATMQERPEWKPKQKKFNVMFNVGKAKYVINYFDGISAHKDGSDFFDIYTFRRKKYFEATIKQLKKQGYIES